MLTLDLVRFTCVSVAHCRGKTCAGIFKQSRGAKNPVGIGLSYRPNWFLGIDSWAPQKFKNSGTGFASCLCCQVLFRYGT
jgi:hypothetical protein